MGVEQYYGRGLYLGNDQASAAGAAPISGSDEPDSFPFAETLYGDESAPVPPPVVKMGVPMTHMELKQEQATSILSMVKHIYQAIAPTFAREREGKNQEWFKERADFLIAIGKHYHPHFGDEVLDSGCGTGDLLHYLVNENRLAKKGVGIDVTPEMVELSRKKWGGRMNGKLSFVEANAEDLRGVFPDNSFDVVMSTFSDIHLFRFRQAFAEKYRVLKDGGRALIMVPTPHRFMEYMENARKKNGSHTEGWWDEKLAILEKQGFLWVREVFPEMASVLGTNSPGIPTLCMMEEQWIVELEKAGFTDVQVFHPSIENDDEDSFPRYMVVAGVARKSEDQGVK